jgi:hypothetical protein
MASAAVVLIFSVTGPLDFELSARVGGAMEVSQKAAPIKTGTILVAQRYENISVSLFLLLGKKWLPPLKRSYAAAYRQIVAAGKVAVTCGRPELCALFR